MRCPHPCVSAVLRPRRFLVMLAASFIAATVGFVNPAAADRFRATDQLPETTVVYVRIRNTAELVEKMKQTAVGAALQDPQVRPLVGQLWGSLGGLIQQFEDDAGVGVEQLLASLPGELIIAGVDVPAFPLAWSVMFRVDEDHPLMETLEVGEQRLKQAGYQSGSESIDGVRVRVLSSEDGPFEEIVQMELGDWRVITTSRRLAGAMIALRARELRTSLADYAPFRTVLSRCDSENKSEVQWYVDPINLAKTLTRGNFAASAGLALLPAIGVDGIQAVGGSVAVADGQFDLLMRNQVVIDPPRDGVLDVAALGSGNTDPEIWVPADAANYVTWHVKLDEMYSAAKKLNDSFRGEGATKRFLDRRLSEGLGVEAETELLPALTGRISRVQVFEKPVTAQSQSSALGLELVDPDAFLPVLDKIVDKWSDRLRRESFAGVTYYQWVSAEEANGPDEGRDRDADDRDGSVQESRDRRRRNAQRQAWRRAAPVAMILGNTLVIADRLSTAERLVMTLNDAEPRLRDELEYKLVVNKLKRFSSDPPGMVRFERPEKGLEVLYGLLQTEEAREDIHRRRDENPFLATIDDMLQENRFPAFSVLARYFAPGGSAIFNEQTGFHHVLFSLQRQRPEETSVLPSGR